jgi:hypothetical protein
LIGRSEDSMGSIAKPESRPLLLNPPFRCADFKLPEAGCPLI